MAKSPSPQAATPFDILLDYEERSLAHVAGRPEMIEAPGHWRGVGFRLGQRRLVSSFDEVVEILPLPPVTPVPGAHAWMLGVANLRGQLHGVVDTAIFLGLSDRAGRNLADVGVRDAGRLVALNTALQRSNTPWYARQVIHLLQEIEHGCLLRAMPRL